MTRMESENIDIRAIDWFVVRTFLDSARETQKPGFCVKSREDASIAIETRFLGLSARDSETG
ncbi:MULTISPECIES: hypothetical protein, partial [unclassified Microcoleus]